MPRAALVTGPGTASAPWSPGACHRAGYAVALADLDLDAAQEAASRLDPLGATALALRLDVRLKGDFERACADLVSRWGGVDVLVNNAAVTVAGRSWRSPARNSTRWSP